MLGTIVNVIAIFLGGILGLIFTKGLSKKLSDTLMKGIGLCILFIAIKGSLVGKNALVLILSMVLGALIGESLDLDLRLHKLGDSIQSKFGGNDGKISISEGFVSGSLLYCVGAMAVVGSLQSGLTQNHETLFTKSMLDGITAVILASQFGVGVLLSGLSVLLYQGSITLLSQWISPFMSDIVINEMSCVGFVIIIGIALNMLGITKLKCMNYVPAIFVSAILVIIINALPIARRFFY